MADSGIGARRKVASGLRPIGMEDIEAQIKQLKKSGNLPKHVAIIMDGNGRWARKRRLPRLAGHRAGREPVRMCVRTCAKLGVEYLTLYTFSEENWRRPKSEITAIMRLLYETTKKEIVELLARGSIQVAGGLVSEQHERIVRQGPRNGHALLLSPGELLG